MIIFTDHALLKLKQRRIGKNFVLRTLAEPDTEASSYGSRRIRYKKFRKLIMAVVFVKEANDTIVLTVHWVEKMPA